MIKAFIKALLEPHSNPEFESLYDEILADFETYKTIEELAVINRKLGTLVCLAQVAMESTQVEHLIARMRLEIATVSFKA